MFVLFKLYLMKLFLGMKNVKIFLFLFAFVFSIGAFSQKNLIPKPQNLELHEGVYKLGETIKIKKDKDLPEIQYLSKQLQSITDKKTEEVKRKTDIQFSIIKETDTMEEGYYTLTIDKNGIAIEAPSNKGLFYGVQTLIQIIEEHRDDLELPYLSIKDQPEFAYRGMHLDVSRHFFSIDEIKNYLDYLAAYKYNKFHWHLTEDQGWRIEIKKYPKLQEVAAYRNGSMVGHHSDQTFDEVKYGGYYTQEEAKEIVEYAKNLHIDVIPEIEMPGHAQAAIAAYPELGCKDESIEVWQEWGISENIFCPKEETFEFLEGVIDEIVEIFPYEYIHIGGDEAPKTQWEESDFAQEVMKREGLKDEEELQSYFVTRMEKYINSKGKKIIGWDEILQGGLAPNATVMSWTGIEGGIEAAKTGHKAIMSPTSTNYFDYYQGNPENEPLAIGGNLRLQDVYAYKPVPDSLEEEKAKYIWGVQGNLWTEYIVTFDHVEYMIFPRMMALSEVAWGTADPENYEKFEDRVTHHFDVFDRKGINHGRAIYEVDGEVVNKDGQLFYELSTNRQIDSVRYTTNKSEPTASAINYTKPIPIDAGSAIKAAYFRNGKQVSATTYQDFSFSKSTGKNIELKHKPLSGFSEGRASVLVDGIHGNTRSLERNWLAFQDADLVATIDLEEKTEFSNVQFTSMESPESWVYYAKGAKVSVSDDGNDFEAVKTISADAIKEAKGRVNLNFDVQNARYIKVEVENLGTIPEGNPGEGSKAHLFVDEIVVN